MARRKKQELEEPVEAVPMDPLARALAQIESGVPFFHHHTCPDCGDWRCGDDLETCDLECPRCGTRLKKAAVAY